MGRVLRLSSRPLLAPCASLCIALRDQSWKFVCGVLRAWIRCGHGELELCCDISSDQARSWGSHFTEAPLHSVGGVSTWAPSLLSSQPLPVLKLCPLLGLFNLLLNSDAIIVFIIFIIVLLKSSRVGEQFSLSCVAPAVNSLWKVQVLAGGIWEVACVTGFFVLVEFYI